MLKHFSLVTLITMLCFVSYSQDNTIPTTGNVGLGTLSPTSRLEVNGDLRVDSCLIVNDTSRFNSEVTMLGDLSVMGTAKFQGTSVFSSDVQLPNLTNDNNNLGLGSKIVVVDQFGLLKEVHFDEFSSKISGDIYTPEIPNDPLTLCQLAGYLDNPVWHNGTNKIFSECSEVNVGIGTDTPLSKLDVRGSGYFTENLGIGALPNPVAQIFSTTTSQIGMCIDHNWNGNYGYVFKAVTDNDLTKGIGVYNSSYSKDVFTVYGNGKMVVQNDTGPILQLEPNGLLRSRTIKIDTDIWPDYVFDENYPLMSLDEIELFIGRNGHLPGVPSEEEVVKDGIDVGAMNVILLQKVEELTLLLIQQQQELEELKKQVNKR